MKSGDKIYCIKSWYGLYYKEHKFYTIDGVTTYDKISHSISNEDKETTIYCIIIRDRYDTTVFTTERYRDCYYFYDYFITEKELRKKKLNELQNKI